MGLIQKLLVKLDEASMTQLERDFRVAGAKGSAALQVEFDRKMADNKYNLANKVINEKEFVAASKRVTDAFNNEILAAMSRLLAAGKQNSEEYVNLAKQLKNVGDAGQQSGNILSTIWTNLKSQVVALGAGIAAAFSVRAIIGFIEGSVKAAAEAERIWTGVRGSVEAIGLSWDQVGAQVEAAAEKVQNTSRFSSEAAAKSIQILIDLTHDYNGSLKALGPTVDFAAAKGLDLETASRMVGQALVGNTMMLGKYIPAVKDGADVMESLSFFSGRAAKDLNTWGGQIEHLANLWDDLKKQLGNVVIKSEEGRETLKQLSAGVIELTKWVVKNKDEIGYWIKLIGEFLLVGFRKLGEIIRGTAADIRNFSDMFALIRLAALRDWNQIEIVIVHATQRILAVIASLNEGIAKAAKWLGLDKISEQFSSTARVMRQQVSDLGVFIARKDRENVQNETEAQAIVIRRRLEAAEAGKRASADNAKAHKDADAAMVRSTEAATTQIVATQKNAVKETAAMRAVAAAAAMETWTKDSEKIAVMARNEATRLRKLADDALIHARATGSLIDMAAAEALDKQAKAALAAAKNAEGIVKAHKDAATAAAKAWDEFVMRFRESLDQSVNAVKGWSKQINDIIKQYAKDNAGEYLKGFLVFKEGLDQNAQQADYIRMENLQKELDAYDIMLKNENTTQAERRRIFERSAEIYQEMEAIKARATFEVAKLGVDRTRDAEERKRKLIEQGGMAAVETSKKVKTSWLDAVNAIVGALSGLGTVFGGIFGTIANLATGLKQNFDSLSSGLKLLSKEGASTFDKIAGAAGAAGAAISIVGGIVSFVTGLFHKDKDPGRRQTNQRAYQAAITNTPWNEGGYTDPLAFLLGKSPKSKGGGGGWATEIAQNEAWNAFLDAIHQRDAAGTLPEEYKKYLSGTPIGSTSWVSGESVNAVPGGTVLTEPAPMQSPTGITGRQVTASTPTIPRVFQQGGAVDRTGLAFLHAGETVLSPLATMRMGGQSLLASINAALTAGRPLPPSSGGGAPTENHWEVNIDLHGVADRDVPRRIVDEMEMRLGQKYQQSAALTGNVRIP